jgi:predicted Rossmann-fold nucleotide-binding protein
MLEPMKVLVTGSSALPIEHLAFATEFGTRLIRETPYVLVTGGLLSKEPHERLALDHLVSDAAVQALDDGLQAARARIMTILPDPKKDFRGARRLSVGDVVTVPHANVRTRRYSLVMNSDAVVAINGAEATREVIDLAYAAMKPLIPFPGTGGAAFDSWHTYRDELTRRLRLSEDDVAALAETPSSSRAVSKCLQVLTRALGPRCFVAMSFADHPLANAFGAIRAVAEGKGYQVIRVDQEAFTGNIVEAIWDSIRDCDVAIGDLSGHKPNVYYEIGVCHALKKKTVLVVHSRDGTVPSDIPFDIRMQRVLPYDTVESLRAQLKDYLSPIDSRARDTSRADEAPGLPSP